MTFRFIFSKVRYRLHFLSPPSPPILFISTCLQPPLPPHHHHHRGQRHSDLPAGLLLAL